MRRFLRLALALSVSLIVPEYAYAQASITGAVRDTSGAVLPGVTVEAASPVLIERVRIVVTDGTGQYRIEQLRPGTYVVTFSLPSFSTVRREGIELTGSFVATVNAEMRVGALEETVTVSGESPVLDVQSAVRQRVLSQEVLESVPASRSPTFMAALVPGITRPVQDVGGTSGDGSTAGGVLTVRGVPDNRIATAGASNTVGTGTAHGAYNLEAYQEVVVNTGGTGVEHREGGVNITLIPRDGGNTFRGSFLTAFSNSSMQGNNLSQDLKGRGLGAPDSIEQLLDVNPAFGGPIRRDRLWFHGSGRYARAFNYVPQFFNKNAGNPNAWAYEPDTSAGPASNRNTVPQVSGRVTWQATPKNKLAVMYDFADICDCPRGLSASVSPEANMGNWTGTYDKQFWTEWTAPVNNRLLLEATAYRRTVEYVRIAENAYFPASRNLVEVLEQSNGLRYRASPSTGDLWLRTLDARAVASYITGAHALKVGFSGKWGSSDMLSRAIDAPLSFRFNNGVPNQVTLFALPHTAVADMDADHGLFVQDRWTVDRVTLTGGLRYDYFSLTFPEQGVGPTVYTPNRTIQFPETAGPKWHDLSPRLSVALDLFGDAKTALKASFGKYLAGEAVSGTMFTNMSPLNLLITSTNRSWNDANRNFVPDCDLADAAANGECGRWSDANFGGIRPALAVDPEILSGWNRRRNNWQFVAGIQREILPRVSVEMDYWRTWFDNFIVTQNRAYTAADFDAYSIIAPTDSRLPGGGGYLLSGLVDVKPDAFGRAYDGIATFADNFGKQIEHWNGVDVTVNARPGPGLLLQGGTSTGRQTTDNCDVVTSAGPQPPTRGATLPVFNPSRLYCHVEGKFLTQLKLLGTLTVPRLDVQLTATFQSLPGPELSAAYTATNADVRSALGRNLAGGASNVTIGLIEPRSMYGERLNQLDLRVAKILRFGRTRFTAGVDLYNALNSDAVLLANSRFATWLQPQSILNARFAKVVGQLNF